MSVTFWPVCQTRQNIEESLQHNVCNANAADLVEAMGLPREDYVGGEMPIDTFINRCRNYLRSHIGKPSDAILPEVDKERGKCEVIFFGRREGYINEKLHALVVMAERAKTEGALTISWG